MFRPNDHRCKMGGLRVDLTGIPAPHYNFEMLHADTGKLYMHFNVSRSRSGVSSSYSKGTEASLEGALEREWFIAFVLLSFVIVPAPCPCLPKISKARALLSVRHAGNERENRSIHIGLSPAIPLPLPSLVLVISSHAIVSVLVGKLHRDKSARRLYVVETMSSTRRMIQVRPSRSQAFPKHSIPLVGERGCRGDMRVHQGSFGNPYPCKSGSNLSREGLMKCLPALTPSCAQHLSHLDPSRRRCALYLCIACWVSCQREAGGERRRVLRTYMRRSARMRPRRARVVFGTAYQTSTTHEARSAQNDRVMSSPHASPSYRRQARFVHESFPRFPLQDRRGFPRREKSYR